jgi:glutathione S-transferase
MKNLGIDFKEQMVFLFEKDTNEILKPYFSNEKVPILLDDELQVWDTLAIIEYIADKFPEKQGWPEDAKDRAIARSVAAEMHSSFTALRNALPMNISKQYPDYPITTEVQIDIDRIVVLWEHCQQHASNKGPWLLGGFSGADAMFAPVVMRLITYDVKLSGFAADYVNFVLKNSHMQSWLAAGKLETQIIEEDEV